MNKKIWEFLEKFEWFMEFLERIFDGLYWKLVASLVHSDKVLFLVLYCHLNCMSEDKLRLIWQF